MRTPITLTLVTALAAFGGVLFGGCAADPQSEGVQAPGDFAIAPDFHFDSTRPAQIRITRDAASLPATAQKFRVFNEAGSLLMEGALQAGQTFESAFPLPRHEHELVIEVGGVEQRVSVDADGVALAEIL